MNEVVYFIGNDKTFMVNALTDGIKREGLECKVIPLESGAIGAHMNEDAVFLLHVDEDVVQNKIMLNYLCSACDGCNLKLFVIGYPEFINRTRTFIPQKYIWGCLEQPISAKDIVDRINNMDKPVVEKEEKKHILVIDDSGPTLHAVKGWLEPEYKVSIVDSAKSGLEYLSKILPDLVLLDYEMPGQSGPEVLEIIRNDRKTAKLPVIFLTAKDDRDSVSKVIDLKPQGYILKALPPEKIVAMIDEFFEKHNKKH